MKICFVTGGTGGHIYPALALADKMKELDSSTEILFIGNDDRMEKDLIPQNGYAFKALHTSGLVGNALKKCMAVCQMFKAEGKAKKYLKEFNPDVVIGFGGYVSAPVIMAAHSLGIHTVIHEQNKKTILIVMGSLGSSSVNELMKSALKDVNDDLQFLYVCGKDNSQDLNLFESQKNIHVVPYVDTLRIYGHVDGMVCRAGATTLAEVTALGIPSIVIPSPYVANNHQFYNASMLLRQQACRIIEEKDLNAETLQGQIVSLYANPVVYEQTHEHALQMGKPNAAYDIIDLLKNICKKGN